MRFGIAAFLMVAVMGFASVSAQTSPQTPAPAPALSHPAENEIPPQPADTKPLPEDALEVTSTGTLEWLKQEQMYVARQNAVAKRNDTTVMADELVAHYRIPKGKTSGSEISQVTAEGNPVKLLSPTAVAYGQHGIYDLDKQVVILTGNNLKLITTQDVITARDSLEYFEETGIGVARGNAVAVQGDDKLTADTISAKFAKQSGSSDKSKPSDKTQPKPQPVSTRDGPASGQNPDKPKSGLERLDAKGHVVLVTPTDVITGDEGVYNPVLDQATVLGNVHVTRDKNQLDGVRAEVDLATGISRVYPAPNTRVRGLFVPKKKGETDNQTPDNG